jgi:hypothetical protein
MTDGRLPRRECGPYEWNGLCHVRTILLLTAGRRDFTHHTTVAGCALVNGRRVCR